MKPKLKTLAVILLATIGMIILFIIIVGGANYFQKNINKSFGNFIMTLFPVFTFFYALIFNKKYNHLSGKTIGFYPSKLIKNIAIGITLVFVFNLIAFAIASSLFGVHLESIPLKPNFGKPLLTLFMTCIMIGIWEEFYFRGLVFNTLLKNNFGFHLSAFISALLFSIVHWSSFDMAETSYFWYVGIVFMGYIFAIMYTYFNSIWAVVSFHFFWDVIAIFFSEPDNKIGFMAIKDYALVSKNIDNAEVLTLGIILALLLYFIVKKEPKSIQSYIENISKNEKLNTIN